MKLPFFAFALLCPFFVKADTPAPSSSSSNTPTVQVSGRQLLVDGKPFTIKAVCYSPVRKGMSYIGDDGFNTSSLLTVNPSQDDLALIDADFKAMQEAGVNTIRVYYPITNPDVLAKLDFYNIKVIVPVFTTYQDGPGAVKKNLKTIQNLKYQKSTLFWEVGNEWNYNLFYSNNSASAQPLAGLSNSAPSADSDEKCSNLTAAIARLTHFVNAVKQADATHPVSTCLGDIPTNIEGFWKLLPNDKIDIYGVNIYDGASFNNAYPPAIPRFDRWKIITQPSHAPVTNPDGTIDSGGIGAKPLYISEYGATAYNLAKNGIPLYSNYNDVARMISAIDAYFLPGPLQYVMPLTVPCFLTSSGGWTPGIVDVFGVDEEAQSYGITALATEISNNLSAKDPNNILLGGALFEFNDEWWKAPKSDPATHSIAGFGFADANAGILCGGPYPDNYFHEEWFGIMTIDRQKRPAYYSLQAIYTAEDSDNSSSISSSAPL